ncbi:MAG: endonuclease/exonuclease/phosphatase family protein [Candidatus Marinimicrobia bacterium]|nr:endonuclease/exonuclease/phosphatase family protein [Candidatus Neomarinimicrobiota bacterium]
MKIRLAILILIALLFSGCMQPVEPLKVGFWNVENLFDLDDDPDKRDEEFAIGGRKNMTQVILDQKLAHMAEVLTDLNADLVGLAEVENLKVLEMLNAAYPARNYSIVHYESPDERGIDCALLYDPLRFRVVESEAVKVEIGNPTRDILHVTGKYARKKLHIFVNHWPSHWGGTEQTFPLRVKTARILRARIDALLKKDPRAEILVMGDLNDEPSDPSVQNYLGTTFKRPGPSVKDDMANCGDTAAMKESCGGCPSAQVGGAKAALLWNLMEPFEGRKNGCSYKYRGTDKNIDQIIVSPGLADDKGLGIVENSITIIDGPKYRQQEGDYQGYPFRFWAGDRLLGGYSDHMAVRVAIERK